MAHRPGEHLGKYRIIQFLGKGAFAEVYLGEHRYLKIAAALKVLRFSLTDKEEVQFLAEARTLARLKHTHIVRVLDFDVVRGTAVLIMDYFPEGTLRQRHPRGSRLSLTETVGYVKQIAAALQYAHNQYIIHRDVKPENMLLGSDKQVVLSDFGLALFAPSSDLLSVQDLAGTLPYIAPEQWRGRPGFASDQYSLGIVTYEWLCGVCPFTGPSLPEFANQHQAMTPLSLRERCPELPAAIDQVVLRALAKNPQHRYVSVQAFAQALERASREKENDALDEITLQRVAVSSTIPTVPTARPVFLVAAPADENFVARLRTDLRTRGILLSNEMPISDQENAARQGIRAAHLVVVVVTPQTRSSRLVKEQLHLAQMYLRRLVCLWARGDDVSVMLLDETWGQILPIDVIDARGPRYQTALDELLVSLREDTRVFPSVETLTSTVLEEPRNPYKGLRAFTQSDTTDFFGRSALIEDLVEMLKRTLTAERQGGQGARLLAVVGPSGSGKSSVVLAGLLPHLRQGELPESEGWVYLEPIVPGTGPIESLALTLASHFPDRSMNNILEDLQDDSSRGLHWLAMQLAREPYTRVMLVIDQFEELFTQMISEEERRCFIDLLVTAVTEARGPVIVVLTLRVDFSDRPMHYPGLSRLIEAHRQPIPPMEIQELREVIEEPAALPDVQLTFEGNLVGDLLFETRGQVGALPLLEFTLDQLFQQRDGHTQTLAAYRKIGGVKGALAKHAEAVYASFRSEEHRRLAQALFLRLIDPGVSEQDATRRRAALSELSLSDAKQTAILQEVTDAFIAARLLTTNEIAGTITVEVSHEALIREWKRLSEWLSEGREDIHFQRTFRENVAEWERHNRRNDRLYRGSQLKEASAWARRNVPNKHEEAFLRASAAHQTRSRVGIIALVLLLIFTGGLVAFVLQSGQAPDPTRVTNLHDAGPGSLRQAITTAPDGATITFDPSLRGTIRLTSSNLNISKNLTLRGSGAGNVAISNDSRGFVVYIIISVSVSIFDLDFKNSAIKLKNQDFSSFIHNRGTLSLTNSVISGNRVSVDNSPLLCAGGIFNAGTLTLSNTIVSNNSVSGGNTESLCVGGILSLDRLIITNSTVSDNRASGDNPKFICSGGIYDEGTLALTNSTVSNNRASGGMCRGGIYNYQGTLILTNSTVSGNMTTYNGGGIFSEGGQADITFCTIYGNTAHEGGGSYIAVTNTSSKGVTIRNSIIAGNSAPVHPNISGPLISDGYNLIQDFSDATFASDPLNKHLTDISGDQFTSLGIDPRLQDNGGLAQPHTWTHRLLQGSPAIDRIPPEACHVNNISTDQRGVQRPQGRGCDIGAYEYGPIT